MWFVALIIAVCISLTILLYRHYEQQRRYWLDRGVPGPPASIVFGNLKSLIDNNYPAPLKYRDWTKQYGSTYGILEGANRILVSSDLDVLHDVFVKKFEHFHGRKTFSLVGNPDKEKTVHVFNARGTRWKRLRTISNQSFTVSNLKKLLPTVQDSVEHMIDALDKQVDDSSQTSFDILPFYQELTLDVIGRVALGQSESTQRSPNSYLDLLVAIFNRPASSFFNVIALLFPYFVGFIRRIATATAKFRKMPFPFIFERLRKTIDERKKLKEKDGNNTTNSTTDFIDMFLEAEADVDDEWIKNSEYQNGSIAGYDKSSTRVLKKLTNDEVIAQCFVFLLAGFDTTANSLAYVSYCLAMDTRVQQKLQSEIDEICIDEEISYEQIQQLKYMEIVVKEALRLYPLGAFANSRVCMKECTLAGIQIDEGVYVAADVFSIHYDTHIWGDDADQFRPERWNTDERRHQLAWMPFGAGPRQCIGLRFALIEEKLALCHILRRFNIEKTVDTETRLHLKGASTISPEHVTVRLTRR